MEASKYYDMRSDIKDGDMILYNGDGIMGSTIRYFDNAFYSHIGVAKWIEGRLWTIDMWKTGIEFVPLSRRMKIYNHFCIVRPKQNLELVSKGIDAMFAKVERDTKYDYFLLPRIAIYKKTGLDLVGMGKRDRYVCSELAQVYTNVLGYPNYEKINLITPHDFIRYVNMELTEVLYDTSPKI